MDAAPEAPAAARRIDAMLQRLTYSPGIALPRARVDIAAALQAVTPLIEDVRARGTEALLDQAENFDAVRPDALAVPPAALAAALENLDPDVRDALGIAIEHARAAHTAQLPRDVATTIVPGGVVGQRWVPVNRVGLYVPGGLAVYPSSVVMNVVAAQVADVPSLAVASPAQREFGGLPHPTILATCALLGVTEVYAAGGAGAIAMFAYGAGECAPVDVVTGPGNIYVAAAKRAVMGQVGIDSEAGTTEIAIVADGGACARFIAADLISQAEHDPAAASVLITDSVELADAVDAALDEYVPRQRHAERIRTALSGPQSGVVLTSSLDESIAAADDYAAEHLEIHTENAADVARRIRNAGAIFVGPYSPVPLGDYLAGSNHVLPTGGTARFAAGLSVMAYIKPVQVIEYSAAALAELAAPLTALADAENLPAHGWSARVRGTG